MQEDTYYDVAVIGAGPIGSFAAKEMACAGLSVVLFEKDVCPGDSTVCAGGMYADVVKFIDLTEDVIEKRLRNCRLLTNNRASEWCFSKDIYIMVNRQKLDRYLSLQAQKAGVHLITQARVIQVKPEFQELFYQYGIKKRELKAKAKIFIFADGPRSLAHKIFGRNCYNDKRYEWKGVEYELESRHNLFDRVEITTDEAKLPFGYYWIFPKNDHLNVGLGRFGNSPGPPLWKLLDEFVNGHEDLRGRRILKRKGGVIPGTVSPLIQKDNCLLVGDAAGMINPITGGGYICGFLSAKIAAETCVRAFRGNQFKPEMLCLYKKKLRCSSHYLAIRFAHYFLRFLFLLYRKTNRSFYPSFMRFYAHVSHSLIRFLKVI